jgi:hypothetical protein
MATKDTQRWKWSVRAKKNLLECIKEDQKRAQPQLYGTSYLLDKNTLMGLLEKERSLSGYKSDSSHMQGA